MVDEKIRAEIEKQLEEFTDTQVEYTDLLCDKFFLIIPFAKRSQAQSCRLALDKEQIYGYVERIQKKIKTGNKQSSGYEPGSHHKTTYAVPFKKTSSSKE